MEKEVVLFSSLLPPPTGTQLDELFLKRGWQLQRWVSEGGTPGYQIYFGPGVQVDNHYEYGFPYHEVEALARVLLPEIQAFFESEDGQREYAEWKAKQQAEQENKV